MNTEADAMDPIGGMLPMILPEGFRSGFVALVGRPNAGKSTLLNAVVGQKVAITSNVSQTTRRRIRGILTTDDAQLVLVDTPGLHKPRDVLGEELNASALTALSESDAIAFLIDSRKPIGRGDEWVLGRIRDLGVPLICVLTKRDAVDERLLEQQVDKASRMASWDALICLSAKTGYNVDAFTEECIRLLPEGPMWFPRDDASDVDIELMASDAVREQVLHRFRDEVPHSVGVAVDDISFDGSAYRIGCTVLTERDSQKAMIIGKGGASIRDIGTAARKELEDALGCVVHLNLSVKSRPGWRSDIAQLERFGYVER